MGVGARIRFLVLCPLQGCTICRLVSLARPRRLAEPDLAQNSITTADVIASTCPLGRLHDMQDAMRLLNEHGPRRPRDSHRYRLAEDEHGALFVDKNVD